MNTYDKIIQENHIEKQIDQQLKMNQIDEGTYFYLKEICKFYERLNKEKNHIIKNNIENNYKLRTIEKLIYECEFILEKNDIILNVKKIIEPKISKKLLKIKPIIAFNTLK